MKELISTSLLPDPHGGGVNNVTYDFGVCPNAGFCASAMICIGPRPFGASVHRPRLAPTGPRTLPERRSQFLDWKRRRCQGLAKENGREPLMQIIQLNGTLLFFGV